MGRPLVGPPHGHGAGSHLGGEVGLAGAGEPASSHTHPHPHPHPHPHLPEDAVSGATAAPPVGEARPSKPSQGVVVDVGDGVGALVLYAEPDREWLEPEIHRIEEPAQRQHVWVLERIVGSGSVYAAVFPSLPEGRYGICSPDGVTAQEVEIVGGSVTTARWQ